MSDDPRGKINVDVGPDGKVCAVWFGCRMLPFTERKVDQSFSQAVQEHPPTTPLIKDVVCDGDQR